MPDIQITLTPQGRNRLMRPARGRGGFQVLLRKLQNQIEGDTLTMTSADFERWIRYSTEYGQGGFEERLKKLGARKK